MVKKTVTLTRRQPYITRSNRYKIVKTPSKKLVTRKIKKLGKVPSCGDCKKKLQGITPARPAAFARLKKSQRTVARVYGGVLCSTCVQERVMMSFLSEEEKILKVEYENK